MKNILFNNYWRIELSNDFPVIEALMFDEFGYSSWSSNLLKTVPIHTSREIAKGYGAQTGYFSKKNEMILSCFGKIGNIERKNSKCIIVDKIQYGDVEERWTLELQEDKFIWIIEQKWNKDIELLDIILPGFFFSTRPEYGIPTEFEIWTPDIEHDDFYGHEAIVEGAAGVSRKTTRWCGKEETIKLLSNICPRKDWKVYVTHYLKKGALLNKQSLLAQTLWCEPASPSKTYKIVSGQQIKTKMILSPSQEETGLQLITDLKGELGLYNKINKRFYDVYTNCGILADTLNWRFGNTPYGYVCSI